MFRLIQLLLESLLGGGSARPSENGARSQSADAPVNGDGYTPSSARPKYNFDPAAMKLPKISRSRKFLIIFVVALVVILSIVLPILAGVIPDILWYTSLGYSNVLWVQYFAPVVIFTIGFVAATFFAWLSLVLVFRLRPTYQVSTFAASDIEALKAKIAKHKNKWFFAISGIIGLLFGLVLTQSTRDFLLLFGSNSFGEVDPIFGNDASFYVFILPGLSAIINALQGLFIIMLLVAFLTGAVFGQTKMYSRQVKYGKFNLIRINKPLRIQLSVYAAFSMVLLALQIFLTRYDLLNEAGDRITGAGWVDANVRIPLLAVVSVLCLVIAVLFLVAGLAGNAKLPLIALGATVLLGVASIAALPPIFQALMVTPNAQQLEKPYIDYNMSATQKAFKIDDVDITPYNATTETKPGQLKQDAETTAQIRLLDPQIVPPTFRQLQQNKQYYGFQDALSVDKYTIDGKSYDTVIAARELDLNGSDQRNWVNDHTVYTHGFGVVAGYGNQVTADGRPLFFEKDIPTQGALSDKEDYEPRIYFSKNSPDYSIVGAPEGQSWEFDNPEAKDNYTFNGTAGPDVSNPLVKLLYTLRFGDIEIFMSDRVNSASQIIYNRDPEERVQKVAPYLELDGRVYPAVVDGRVKWILDAYTTTDRYPYSAQVDLSQVTKDTLTETSNSVSALDAKQANYVRNSVKATVDAYDGSVTLYAWDADDPVLKAWSKIYGQNLHPISEISGDLMSHMRYPENLFKIQRSLLAKYHVTGADAFFSGQDFWQVPSDPTKNSVANSSTRNASTTKQPPYYLSLKMPDAKDSVFSLTSTFIPGGGSKREILTGFLSADSDAGTTPGVVGPNYGKLHLLELPKNTTVPGPGQAQNNFNSSPDVSRELNLLSGNSSSILAGNLLTLPIGGGLVYVQPVYVQSTGGTAFPLLKKVLVAFGDKVGFANTLQEALNQVFGGDSGAKDGDDSSVATGDEAQDSSTPSPSTPSETPGSSGGEPIENPGNSNSSSAALDKAKKAIEDARRALDEAYTALENASGGS
ncbi:MAG: UPF0182 family protein [Candidatus Ancillula sp.]|nr:UPF0182 family protein [Candidatus Ancillula sp.]